MSQRWQTIIIDGVPINAMVTAWSRDQSDNMTKVYIGKEVDGKVIAVFPINDNDIEYFLEPIDN